MHRVGVAPSTTAHPPPVASGSATRIAVEGRASPTGASLPPESSPTTADTRAEALATGPAMLAHGWDAICIEGIRVEAVIGFSAHERDVLQPLDVDLVLETVPPATYVDEPASVLDYKRLKDRLRHDLLGRRFQLLEAFAETVARTALEHPAAQRVTVTAHKPGALTGARDVAVRLTRSRA